MIKEEIKPSLSSYLRAEISPYLNYGTQIIMELTNSQKKKLKGLAHDLHPLVTIGQKGLKESIHDEIENALDFHQLVKIKVIADDRNQRQELIELITEKHKAELIQTIGHIAILYRRNNDKPSVLKAK